ncbi:S-layer homology domain-containing protein [Paenibacillus sp. SYP-B4298]|uniref:S-layer homology domain-containing protein n=1 Tax=Paenibacillus sp. SYP-B4298 TaxID=2996034 RepID=UPI0022DD04E7|nr:5'-nucleotidase C-terminal domain-containing protein [Paenibacillus sp. SYP-B4298]
MYSKQAEQAQGWLRIFLAFILLATSVLPVGPWEERAAAADGDQPLSVTDAIARNNDGLSATVEGYVVGYFNGSINSLQTAAPYSGNTNFGIADQPDETNISRIMPVQVPNVTAVRQQFGLNNNPELRGRKVRVASGVLSAYFGVPGIRSDSSTVFQLVEETGTEVKPTHVAKVAASPAPGALPVGTAVTLSTATDGAAIYYRLGSSGEYVEYTAPIQIGQATTVEAYAVKEGLENSELASLDYTIADTALLTIAEARVKPAGTAVTVQGIVTYREESGGMANLYVQDGQAGIVVRGTDSTVEPGDRIEAYGPITLFNGLVQIEKDKSGFAGGYIRVIQPAQGIPAPVVLTSKDFAPAADGGKGAGGIYEGMLVTVKNVQVTRNNSSTFYVTDQAGGEFIIYAKNSPSALTPGASYEQITGVMTYHSSYGLELVPRTAADVTSQLLSVVASKPSGGIVKDTTVSLSSPMAGATIYYTLDDSEPTRASAVYSGPISVGKDTVIRAIAVLDSSASAVYTFRYTVLQELDRLRIHDIQGAAHRSLYDGQAVQDVEGIVTTVVNASSFYMQEIPGMEDSDDRTSEGILVYKSGHSMAIGNKVKVSGQVKEYSASATELPVTEIVAGTIAVSEAGQPLPQPIVIGTGGRIIPKWIDSDRLALFNPEKDAIDFYESLEGMRVQLNQAEIIGPYSSEPGLAVTVDNGDRNPLRTPAGGVILTGDGAEPFESTLNPQRLFINRKPSETVKTGDRFAAPITGVLTYASGNYKLQPDGNLPGVVPGGLEQATAAIAFDKDKLTVATFNLENFSKKDAERALQIGDIIVKRLHAPDVIGVMEVQDNDGPTDSGTTAADESFRTLIEAIASKGGPVYAYTEIAPANNQDGGAPGANIRVGFLYNQERVSLKQGNAGDATTAIQVQEDGTLSLNPGRIEPLHEAFTSSRKPLAAEFEFHGERVVVIANHFNSKGGDLKPYGSTQPATRSSEVQRAKQAAVVNGFIKALIAKDPAVNVVALGDFNDFQFSRTLNIVAGDELDNLVNKLPENSRYSYIYDGNSQTLDHILTSKNISASAVIEAVHVNADFAAEHGRVSDHDPLLAQLAIGGREEGDYALRVLHTNDTHAHLDNIARRVTAIKELRNDSTLVLDAGDVMSGTLYFNRFNGLADLEFMNRIGYDAMTFGNHEFDKGTGVLAQFVQAAKFPFVSANIDVSQDGQLGGLSSGAAGEPGEQGRIYPAIIKEVKGEKVGIFGLTTLDTVSLSSPGDKVKFADYKASAEATVAMLEREGVNKIIALTHLGYADDLKLAEAVAGIDIVVGGHSHTILNEPVVVRTHKEPTLVVQTGEYNVSLGQLDVTFDVAGALTSWNGKLLKLDEKDSSGQYRFAEDPEAAAKLKEYAEPLAEYRKTVVGSTRVRLDGERGSVRKQETNLGNLVAQGMLEKVKSIVKEPDVKGYVAIQNGGGIRASIQQGDITLGDLLTVMPFGNNLSALKMTGKEIAAALENGVSGVETGEGRFPQVAGMQFYYDSTKPGEKLDSLTGQVKQTGQRVVKVQLRNSNGTYTDMDPNAYYIVATNSFMAGGGDFYRAMRAAKDDNRYYELNLVDYEVFLEHLNRIGVVGQQAEGHIIDLKGKALPTEGEPVYYPSPGSGGGNGSGSAPGAQPARPETPNQPGATDNQSTEAPAKPGVPTSPGTPTVPGSTPGGGETAPNTVFSDAGQHWASAAIAQAAARGIVNGYQDGSFRPNETATRAEFVTMLARAFSLEQSSSAVKLKDAEQIPTWARGSVAQAMELGIITGYADQTFRPSGTISRVELAVMVVRALGLPVKEQAELSFADANSVPAWAVPYVAAVAEAGLMQGAEAGRFLPQAKATRAEVTAVLLAALKNNP